MDFCRFSRWWREEPPQRPVPRGPMPQPSWELSCEVTGEVVGMVSGFVWVSFGDEILSSYMGNIILVPTVGGFVFFLNFHPPKPWGIHDPIWLSSAYFWQMGGEKNHQRKDEIWIRAIQKPKPYRIGWWDFQIFHNLLGSKGREAKCPAGRRTFPQPRCSTCELLSGRVRMSPVVPRSPTSPLVTLLRWKL